MKDFFGQKIKDSAKKTGDAVKNELLSIKQDAQTFFKEKKYKNILKKHPKHKIKQYVMVILSIGLFASGGMLLWFASLEIPDVSSFDHQILGQSTKIYDKTGKVLLYDLGQNVRRTVLPLEEISPNIQKASIAIEDSEFYNHKGIRPTAIIRAVFVNIFSLGPTQGGSTITQQVIKNGLLTKDKTITRKIKEWVLALKIEKKLTKNQILEIYLNQSPYGGTVYGVEEASRQFFNKSAKDVSLAEAAYIAAIPQAPTYYSPYGSHRDALENRKNLVLSRMKELGYINEEEFEQAKNDKIVFDAPFSGGIKAPHFVMYVREYVAEKYGEEALQDGGLKVTTTLDYELQRKAEEILNKYTLENAKNYNATNSGLVAIDARTGQMLVMVGSRDYFDKEIEGNFNVTTAKRQPGSSFKPFVYALAFNKGYRPETILFDTKTQFGGACPKESIKDTDGCYSPDNYDGKFRGPMSIRNALAQSINIPAVKTLYLVGINEAIDLATKMGITTLTEPDRYGLSLVLGGGEVTLVDMTGAYSVFATGGVKHQTSSILKIEDKAGNILEEWKDNPTEVLPKDTALLISDVLSDNVARTPIFGANSSLNFGNRDVAAKTGTTNFYRDAWVVGYTPQVSVGAWSGNNDNSPIDRRVAGYIIGPMWHAFMVELLKTLPNEEFEKPEQKDLSDLKPVLRGSWAEDPNGIHSILYYVNKNDPLGPQPENPYLDPQFENWEYSVTNWLKGSGVSLPNTSTTTNNSSITVKFTDPENEDTIYSDRKIYAKIKINSEKNIKRADYFFNNIFVGNSIIKPFSLSFIPDDVGVVLEKNTLKVIVTDEAGNQSESSIILNKK